MILRSIIASIYHSIQAKRDCKPAPYLIRGNPPASYKWFLPEKKWIPAFAGMTVAVVL